VKLALLRSSQIQKDLANRFAVRTQVLALAARTRYAGGKGSLAEVALIGVRQARYQERAAEQAGEENALLAELAYLTTGGNLKEWLARTGELTPYAQKVAKSLGKPALERAPAVQLAVLEEKASKAEQTLARLDYAPDFALFAGLKDETLRRQAFQAGEMREQSYSVGLSLRVPLWTALSNHQNTKASQENRAAAASRHEETLSRIKQSLMAAQARIQSIASRRNLYKSSLLPQARAARESALVAYEVGRQDFASLLNTWDTLYELENEAAMLEAQEQQIIFEQAAMLGLFTEETDEIR